MKTTSSLGRLADAGKEKLGVGSRPVIVGRAVTATITLICVLIVYDGWSRLSLTDAVSIVVAPIIAVFTSHVFGASLVQHVELGRRPSKREWFGVVRFESRFLLLAVPPAAILVILNLASVSLTDAIRIVVWLEALSLGFWAGLAAHYAGFRGRGLALAVLAGLAVGVIILTLQILLEPGEPVRDGTAAGGAAYLRSPITPTRKPIQG